MSGQSACRLCALLDTAQAVDLESKHCHTLNVRNIQNKHLTTLVYEEYTSSETVLVHLSSDYAHAVQCCPEFLEFTPCIKCQVRMRLAGIGTKN